MDMTFLHSLALNAVRFPRKDAIVQNGQSVSYQALFERTRAFMEQLVAEGIGSDDTVGILGANCADFFVAFYAVTGLGAVPALINYRLTDDEVKQVVENADCCAVVVDADWFHLPMQKPSEVRAYFALRAPHAGGVKEPPAVVKPMKQVPDVPWSASMLEQAKSLVMFHTSGTTGLPKGVLRSSMGFMERSVQFGVSAEETFMAVLPACLSGGGAFALWALYIGSTLHLQGKVDYPAMLRDIERYGITVTMLLPNMLNQIIELEAFKACDISSLKTVITGGGVLQDTLVSALQDKFGDALCIYYGASELGPSACLMPNEVRTSYKDNCIGRPFFSADVVLLDDQDQLVPVGEVGRICIKSNMQLDSYYKKPDLIKEIQVGDYLCVGDMGRFDTEGFLYFVGRQRDFIRSGGINVPAADVETVLLKHPAVLEAYCVGLPDPKWGEAICAAIILRAEGQVTVADLESFASAHLSGFKKPRHTLFFDDVPKNLTGRVKKIELAALFQKRLEEAADE